MPKRAMSFKPTSECEVQLAELMDRWGCDRTAAVVRAIAVALDASSEVSLSRVVSTGVQGTKAPEAAMEAKRQLEARPKVLPKDPKEAVRTIKPPAKRGTVEPKKLSGAIKDTRTQQERMDDFYRSNMAKGKK